MKEKGTRISRDIFKQIEPLESILSFFKDNCEVIVATGTKDPYCPDTFLYYLKSLVNGSNFSFEVVKDAPHEVTKECPEIVKKDYMQKLFD